jgi:hypothetical protein
MVDWNSRMFNIPRTQNHGTVQVPLNDAYRASLRATFETGSGTAGFFRSSKMGEPLANSQRWVVGDGVSSATGGHHNCRRQNDELTDRRSSNCRLTTLGA